MSNTPIWLRALINVLLANAVAVMMIVLGIP